MKKVNAWIGMAFTLLTGAFAQTGITYQGFLKQNGAPANGTFNMVFRLFSVATGGTAMQSSPASGTVAVNVQNGLFTQEILFNTSRFTGADRFLEIVIEGTVLSPRVKLNSTPYSLFSRSTRGISVGSDGNIGIGTDTPTSPLHVAAKVTKKVSGNRFQIRTNRPNVEVCWEVKAIRNDLFVRKHGAPVEIDKPEYERGKYQIPQLYDQPEEKGIHYHPEPVQPSDR